MPILGTSTKQPTKGGKKLTKRQKIEASETDLLQKAINYMATPEKPEVPVDGFELFGRHVASELRELSYPHNQRLAKLQIQNVLFNAAQSEIATGFSQSQPHRKEYYNIFPNSPQADNFPVYPSTQSPSSIHTPSISPTPEHQFPPNVN